MKRYNRYIALDKRVLAVAVEGEVKDWAAYIGAVPGNNHLLEKERVAKHGSKLPKEIAEMLFPDFAMDLTWRG